MDVPRVDELLSRAVDDQVAEYREWRLAMEAVSVRVERLEEAVRALCDELGGRVGDAARSAIAEQLEQLTAEIRRLAGGGAEAEAAAEVDLRDDLPYADPDPAIPGRRGRLRRR